MSFVDVDRLTPLALVSQYVVEARGSGHFLTREEVSLLSAWLDLCSGSAESLILVLEDILPERLEKLRHDGKKKFSLMSLRRSLSKRLAENVLVKGA